MRQTKDLRRLQKVFKRRVARLESLLRTTLNGRQPQNKDIFPAVVSYIVIESLNGWALFSRSYYLSCARGTRTASGNPITIGAPTADPIGQAIKLAKPWITPSAAGTWHRRDEPTWHDHRALLAACRPLKCSHQPVIDSALSMNQMVFADLPVFRNFFAHRNQATDRAARNIAPKYLLPSSLQPAQFLVSVPPRRHTPVVLEWLAELTITVDFLCA